tara:strand:- start:365 stop:505 length:141 start_codon:yes stop_codon:yes gene_type:complete
LIPKRKKLARVMASLASIVIKVEALADQHLLKNTENVIEDRENEDS